MNDQKTFKNADTLASFVQYCAENPDLRFWQALRGWKDCGFIYVSDELIDDPRLTDTFYREGK